MWIAIVILFLGLMYCILHIRKLNRILDRREAPPEKTPPEKTPRDICRDLLEDHERRFHRR